MSFRITTNGLFRNYRNNLHENQFRLNNSMEKVSTQRLFNTYAEDPAAASEAFQIRRSMWRTNDQINNSEYLIGKFSLGYNALDPIVDGDGETPDLMTIKDALTAINGTAGSSRAILGTKIQTVTTSIVQTMNVQYNDEYIFAGADGLNAPFTWKDDQGVGTARTLLYRGVDVNAFPPDSEKSRELFREEKELDADAAVDETEYRDWYVENYCDVKVPDGASDEKKQELYDAAYANAAMRFGETTFVDIGLGMQSGPDGTVIPSTAYNSSLSGLDFLGYGVDEDGDSKNLVVLMDELGAIFSRCDGNGEYQNDGDEARAGVLIGKVQDAIDWVQDRHVELSAQVNYLNTNLYQLEEAKLNLNEELEYTERMDLADAITEMMWAQYSYNAALRIGNQILSQSLIDYLN